MVRTYEPNIEKRSNETDIEYIYRMCVCRTLNNLSWKELAKLVNTTLNISYSESWYRKNFNSGQLAALEMQSLLDKGTTTVASVEKDISISDEEVNPDSDVERARDILLKARTERVKLADERAQNRAYVRTISREETLKDIAHEYAEVMSTKKMLAEYDCFFTKKDDNLSNEGILLLSDWHYGMTCDNPWNKFNPEICKERVSKLLQTVCDIIDKENITTVSVLNLSDLIAGRIHTQIRIESRVDVITQTMDVAEILAEFLNALSIHCIVEYYDCLDNHSRLEPNKSESLDLESMVRIIPWYLKERLLFNDRIRINDNEFGEDIITCNVAGHSIIGVHGDQDKPVNALEKLSLMTHKHYDLLCTAHFHHFSADEQHESLIISNGCLMGTDRHSAKLRLTSRPSQTFIVSSPENICKSIHRIVLG